MSVYKKLNEAREKFHGLTLKKTGHNKFAGYYYFELGDFLIPAMHVFKEVGLCALVSFEKEVATMTIVDVDNAEQRIVITSPMGSAALKGCHEVQNIGAVETYQRRYLWVAALEIVEHDALDATTGKEKPEAKKRTGVMADVLKDLPPLDAEGQAYYQEIASDVHEAFDIAGQAEAFDYVSNENLDNEQKLYLSSYLRSDVRAALKKEGEKRRKEKADAGA